MINETFRQIYADAGRYLEKHCDMCVILYCSQIKNEIFYQYFWSVIFFNVPRKNVKQFKVYYTSVIFQFFKCNKLSHLNVLSNTELSK